MAAWRIKSLRLAVRRMSDGYRLETSASHILSVSLSLNDTITRLCYYNRIVLSSNITAGTEWHGLWIEQGLQRRSSFAGS